MTYIQPKDLTVNRIRRTKYSNSFSGNSGALGDGDRGAWQSMPDSTGNPYQYSNFIERWRQYCKLYEMCWEARKIVRIPVEDALRKQWEVEEVPDAMLEVLKEQNIKFKFEESLSKAMMLERLLGGCIQFFGMDSDSDDVSKPHRARVESSKLRFINTIPLSRISRVNWETDPLKEGYMRPHEFIINGHTMHISRCVLWDGDPLFDPYDFALTQFRANLAGFGPSKLAPIWDDIIKAVGTRQAAYQLIQTNNSIIMVVNELQDLMATNPGKANLTKLKEIANNLSIYRAAIIQKDKAEITQSAASFGSVPELLMTFLQVLSAASDIPATRFLGQAPGGLNATGESDLENYYNMIDALQRKRIEPAIRKFYDIIGYHKWPDMWHQVRKKMEIKFPPLWNINELEEAQKNQIEIANVFQAWEAGIMPDEKAIEELNLKQVFSVDLDKKDIDLTKAAGVGGDDSGFYGDGSGSETPPASSQQPETSFSKGGEGKDKAPEKNESTIAAKAPALKKPSLPKIGNNAEFKEEEHPRADDGKFGKGSGATKTEKNKAEKKPKLSDAEKKKRSDEKFKEQMEGKSPEDVVAHTEARERGIYVPPSAVQVWINPDKKASKLATWRDAKGRPQARYSVEHSDEAEVKKFIRLKGFAKAQPKMMKQVEKDFDTLEEAKVLYLINATGFRIGGEQDTKAEKEAFGASTLKPEHIKIEGDSIHFDFIGKEGVRQQHSITDAKLAKILSERTGERLFNTKSDKVRRYLKKLTDDKYMVKDFRTYTGTKTAFEVMQNMEPPKNEKELKKKILEVSTIVSKKLGNTPVMARDNYIDPMVFKAWKEAVDVSK